MQHQTISIVFPIYNGLNYTKIGLGELNKSITHSTLLMNFNIVIIDDGSTDKSFEWITANYPMVHLLKGNGELWWSGGMNLGIDYAFNTLNSDYVLCWNNDITPEINYFREFQNYITNHDGLSLICSKVLYKNRPNVIFTFGCYFNEKNGKILLNGHQLSDDTFDKIVKVDWAGGMGTVISKTIFKEIGYFNNINFPQYKGDADYCLRAKEAGFPLYAIPNLKIYNDDSNTGLGNYNSTFKNFIRSFTAINSSFNFKIHLNFINRHCKSSKLIAHIYLAQRFFFYIMGYTFYSMKNSFTCSMKSKCF